MMRSNPSSYFRFLIEAIFMVMLILQVHLVCAEAEVRCIEREKQPLLLFKAALMDDYVRMLTSWQDNLDCCQWNGVGCSNITGRIQKLDLHGLAAYGPIPDFFDSLSDLRYLDLSYCRFVGKISTQFGSLSHLEYLNLGWNLLDGSIPYQLGNLSKLQYLDLRGNSLEGTIPSQLGKLSSLLNLFLGSNYGVTALKIDNGNDGGVGGQWLSNLTSLTHLDLSGIMNLDNSFHWLQITGKLSKLRVLSLHDCSLSDHFILLSNIPSKFNFSTSLSVLDLSSNFFTSFKIFQWVSDMYPNLVELDLSYNLLEPNDFSVAMNSLEQLDLSNNRLNGKGLKSFMNICTLRSLNVVGNNITEDLPSIVHNLSIGCVKYSLQELHFSQNQITSTLPDLSIFSSLKTLDLSMNQLSGKIPESSKLPSQLEYLSLKSNSLEGGIPKAFGNACSLISLDMSNNSLNEEFSMIIHTLSGCTRYSLAEFDFSNNQINGTLPDLSMFSSLTRLDLFGYNLSGKIPQDMKFPYKLETLDLSSNSLEGVVTSFHFADMSELKFLDLSGNSLALIFSHSWIPPFQLDNIKLRHCMLGPSFPKWLQTQNHLKSLDISNSGISDVVPKWFWALSTKLNLMDISYNNLTGTIPNFLSGLAEYPSISVAANQFVGPIPPFLRRAISLDLSKNKFSSFASFVCANDTDERLGQLDLSNNHLSGQIPDCWSSFKSLAYIDLSNNNFSGQVPTSLGSVLELQVLILRNNSLTGELPFSLKSCRNLLMLDAGENRLSGVIPSWIGNNLQQLQMLSLRRNHFFGSLPLSLCYLTSIHLLDLSSNNLKGRIPKCFKNFTAMTQQKFSVNTSDHSYTVNYTLGSQVQIDYDLIALLMWKGTELEFKNDKLLLKGIDLSTNQLSGEIPTEFGSLVQLVSLNLSRNNLTGEIPPTIGRLISLEFLDLSRNHLFGSIPSGLAQIDRLAMLDLSHNNLSGEIPTSTQLQSFNASSYEENQDLCGPPLEKVCFKEQQSQEPLATTKEDEHAVFFQTFYIGMGLGFLVGFWGICGSILFIRSWRHTYFRFLNNLTDKIMSRWQ